MEYRRINGNTQREYFRTLASSANLIPLSPDGVYEGISPTGSGSATP